MRHASRSFERAHAAYLHHAAREIVEKLAKARPGPGAEADFQQVSADATRLEARFVALLPRSPNSKRHAKACLFLFAKLSESSAFFLHDLISKPARKVHRQRTIKPRGQMWEQLE